MLDSTHNLMNIDVICAQYVSAESDEQKTCLTKNKCFDCDQKKYHYKNCFMNSYSKIQQMIAINTNEKCSHEENICCFCDEFKNIR